MSINMDIIRQTFFSECDEHIVNLEARLLELEESPGDKELVNSIFRAVHSIKGNSGTLGYNRIYDFSHTFETIRIDS